MSLPNIYISRDLRKAVENHGKFDKTTIFIGTYYIEFYVSADEAGQLILSLTVPLS